VNERPIREYIQQQEKLETGQNSSTSSNHNSAPAGPSLCRPQRGFVTTTALRGAF